MSMKPSDIRLAIVTMFLLVICSCCKSKKTEIPRLTPDKLIEQLPSWQIITADRLLDGGTWVIGLQEVSNAEVIFLRIDFSLSVAHPYRRVYLTDKILHGTVMIEVLPNSPLEKRLIEDLESISYGHRVDPDKMPDIDRIIEIVKTRDLSLRLEDPL